MTTKFLSFDLWDKIISLAKKAKRKHIAVAYLGNNSTKLIPMRKGDTLVLDITFGAVENGQTDPFEVDKYLRAGVSVFNCTNLHAKVFVFDDRAIIGSSNLSVNSKNNLVEVGIITSDKKIVKDALRFIKSLQLERVSPEYIKLCKEKYKPISKGIPRKKSQEKVLPTYSRLWILGLSEGELTKEEKRIFERESKKLESKIKDASRYEISWIISSSTSTISSIKEGDLIIQLLKRKAYPPARVLRKVKYKSTNKKKKYVMIFIEEEKKGKRIPWSQFKKILSKVGLGKVNLNCEIQVKKPKAVYSLLEKWS